MQLYVLDRAKNTLATSAEFYNDVHKKALSTGSSTFEFTIDKSEDAAQYLTSGNYVVFQDDHGRAWSFTILDYEEHQTSKTVYLEDVGIELINKNMDIWNTTEAHSFAYYFDLITQDTPWQLGINQVADLSRKLVYTGRDTGLGRLLSILKGFDNAECQFNVVIKGNQPVKFIVDVYKTIGTVQDDIQITYAEELDDITKKESRAAFVTALQGVGGAIQPPEGTTVDTTIPEKHVDFADLEYKDDNFISPKGDKFLRATKANAYFNPGNNGYIESYYDYDTQSASELLNRTLSQLKIYSEPQYTYEASVKVIDPRLDIGDTVTIIDHEYNPALYLRARVSTLEKSYTDPSKGAVTFTNYELINGSLAGKLQELQTIVNSLPGNATIQVINNNINLLNQTQQKLLVRMDAADGKGSLYYDYKPDSAKNGDVAFVKNADGVTEIWKFVDGAWKLDIGIATFDDVKKVTSQAAAAGSQATVAGQQASAAGVAAKSAGDFAAVQASQAAIDNQTARSVADSAVSMAAAANANAGFANDAASQAKSAAADAQKDAATSLAQAVQAFDDSQTALQNAANAQTTAVKTQTIVNDLTGTVTQLTNQTTALDGKVTTVNTLAQQAVDGLALKADTVTVNTITGDVSRLRDEVDIQAGQLSAKVTATDVTGMLNGYATETWSQNQLTLAKNEISASVEKVQTQVDNSAVGTNLYTDTKNFGNLASWWGSSFWTKTTDTYNGLAVMQTTQDWSGLSQYIQVKKGDILTYSVYVKNTSGTGTSTIYWVLNGNPEGSYSTALSNPANNTVTITDSWQRVSGTVVATSDGYLRPRLERTTDNTNTLQIAGIKVEKGSKATDWSLAPEDQATVDWTKAQLDIKDGKISAAVTSLKSDITNATAGMATQTWTQGKLDLTNSQLTAQLSEVQNGLTTKYTELQATLNGVQTTVINAVTQSQLTQLSNQITSTITEVTADSGNLVFDGGFESGSSHGLPELYDSTAALKPENNYPAPIDNYAAKLDVPAVNVKTNGDFYFKMKLVQPVLIRANTYYKVEYDYSVMGKATKASDYPYDDQGNPVMGVMMEHADHIMGSQTTWKHFENTFKLAVDTKLTILRFGFILSDAVYSWKMIDNIKITKDNTYALSSQITQLQDDVNLRVKTGDLINQINISTEGILIDGSKTHITNTTMIDNGVIKTASIADAAITTAKISELAVGTAQIADAAINSAKIASLAVGTAQIADGAISTAKIGTAAITSAQIADASILDAKIVNLDGSKIVAHSITADKLDVNAIAVGLNTYGSGWQITPANIAFLPHAGSPKASLSIAGDFGIMFGDIGNGENLAVVQGTPYDTKTDTWYNGLAVNMLTNGDYFGLSADVGTTTEPKMIWSRSPEDKFNIKKGFSFYDDTFFAGNVTTTADLFVNRIGVKDANNNGHALKYNWVDGVGIAQLAGNGKAGVLIEEVGGDVKFLVDGSQYSLRDIIIHAMHWA